MDTQNIPVANRILAFAKVQRYEKVLILGQHALDMDSIARTIDENRLVVAEHLGTQNSFEPASRTSRTSASPHESSVLDTIIEGLREQSFQLIICTGHPDLTSVTAVHHTLRRLSKLSSPGSRILIEMYQTFNDGREPEHWSRIESNYRQVIRPAGFQLQEINGVAREGDFLTTVADIHAFTVSLANVASSIDGHPGAEIIRRVAGTQRSFLKGACSKDIACAADKSLRHLLGGRERRLFATVRKGG